jgi:3-deoxy-manno-octulosonate cytidylyltransferase (CMP-KDO synthetase)
MMRFLENGYPVRMVETEFDTYSVDTPEDLEKIEQIMRGDQFTKNYLIHSA